VIRGDFLKTIADTPAVASPRAARLAGRKLTRVGRGALVGWPGPSCWGYTVEWREPVAERTRPGRGRSMILSMVLLLIFSGRHELRVESTLGVIHELVDELAQFLDALTAP
jgi:hypothetical protein